MKTSVKNQKEKNELIEHLNDDHSKEILYIAQYYSKQESIQKALLIEIYEEGILAQIYDNKEDVSSSNELFIPFDTKGSLEEKVLFLSYTAMLQLGVTLDVRQKYFEIKDSQMISNNMLRLTIQSKEALSEIPAYAYKFALKKIERAQIDATKKHSPWSTRINLIMLWVMKKVSSERRAAMMKKMERGGRYYTLATSWKSEGSEFNNMGNVDIFLHGRSPGSLWAKSLSIGDFIQSKQEHNHKSVNIQNGQSCLIVDETGYPALLGILQKWKNALQPYVVIVSQEENEQYYFNNDLLSVAKEVIIVARPVSKQSDAIIHAVSHLKDVENTWGVLEKDVAKEVRKYFSEKYNFPNKINYIRGYWVASKN